MRTKFYGIKGWKTHRIHYLPDPLKLAYFYYLEWSLKVIDFWDACPLLPLEETLAIAAHCGVRHPTNPDTGQPAVMTTDFVKSTRGQDQLLYAPASIKSKAELCNLRTRGELEIERHYWAARAKSLVLITENDLSAILTNNVAWIHPYREYQDFTNLEQLPLSLLASILINALEDKTCSLRQITSYYDRYLDFARGTSLSIVRHLIANRLIRVNMLKPINLDQPLTLQRAKPPTNPIQKRIDMKTNNRPPCQKSSPQSGVDQIQTDQTSKAQSRPNHVAAVRPFRPNRKATIEKNFSRLDREVIASLPGSRSKSNG